MADATQPAKYQSGNKFFVVQPFNKDLRDGLIIPLTDKIEELSQKHNSTIDIYINSPGGDGYLCMHLVSLIEIAKASGIKVRTIIPQYAYSAASILAVTGTPGERYIGPTAEHCIHYGTHYGWAETTPLQIERNSEHKKRWFSTLLGHYEKYCKIPKLEEALKDDSYFITAEEAIKFKVADKYMNELASIPKGN